MKKFITLATILLLLTGCGTTLAKLNVPEDLTINYYEEFDPSTVLEEVVEGTEVSYHLDEDNSKLIITLVNGDKEQTLETKVNIEHPLVVPNEDITIDVYKGYDIKDLITVDEDTVIEESLDEEKGILTITAINGEEQETIEVPVKIEDSNPFPCHCVGTVDYMNEDISYIHYYFNEDGTIHVISDPYEGYHYESDWDYDSEDMTILSGESIVTSINEYEFRETSIYPNGAGGVIWDEYKCDKPHPFQ